MKNLIYCILSLCFLSVFYMSCEDNLLNDSIEEQGVKVIHDTIYICPNDKPEVDSILRAGIVPWKFNRKEAKLWDIEVPTRSCRYVYRLPVLANENGTGVPPNLVDPPIDFNWDCDWVEADTIDFINIGSVPTVSPDNPGFFGNVLYEIEFMGQIYIDPDGLGVHEVLGTDSIIIQLNNPRWNFDNPFVMHQDDIIANVGDFLALKPRE